jgi:hypothetical protein
MKKLSNLLAALVFGSLVIFMSCNKKGSDPVKTAAEIQAALLTAGQWSTATSNVTYDGGPSDANWTNFKLTFTGTANGGTYSTGGTTPTDFEDVWPASGNWTFKNDAGTKINRTGGSAGDIELTVSSVTETSLTITFLVSDPTARVSGIYDETWSFTFSK